MPCESLPHPSGRAEFLNVSIRERDMVEKHRRHLSVEYVSPSSLKLDPGNPRIHSRTQLKKLRRSIKRYGFIVPILVVGDNRVVAGNGSLQAALMSGEKQVPIVRLEGLTETEARAFALAHNRLAEDSTWDDRLLQEIFRGLEALDFDLEDTGFSMTEIDLRIADLSLGESAEDADDQFPKEENLPPASTPGDVFTLGRHRIACLDARKEESYAILFEGKKAHIVLTDSPYNLASSRIGGKGRIRHPNFVMAAGEMDTTQFVHFLTTVFQLLARNSIDGSLHYLFMDWRHAYELLAAAYRIYTEYKACCVWTKTNAGMGSLYRSQHEFVFVFKNGRAAHRNNVELGKHGRNRTNVWAYAGMNDFSRQTDEGNLLTLHPSVKPVRLLADALLDASARGDLVLDSFIGSGSTLIAAERVRQICFGLELDQRYIDTTIRRWQRYTGEKALHAASGKRFDDLAARPKGGRRG